MYELQAAVRGKPFLQVKLVETLAQWGDLKDASKYAMKYYISPDKLPAEVQELIPDYVR